MLRVTIFTTLFLLFGCTPKPSEDIVKQQLDIVLKDDLKEILLDISNDAVVDSPRFVITEWGIYDEGKYSYRAEVDFFFLGKIEKKVVRKYRYYTAYQKWDRYYNEYENLN